MWFPILGWAAYFLSFVFLERNWNRDQLTVKKTFMDMVGRTYKRRFWMVLYPEGTRYSALKSRTESRSLDPCSHTKANISLDHITIQAPMPGLQSRLFDCSPPQLRSSCPRLTNVLWPRSKGFNATVECLRPGIDAVLDITVG
mmetsp:Transcript_27377/g.42760  ORF Transcript_27377/g.42760 Transcript_27377/m.42760 type:complete len:143 (+) Transcript_27377:205-633(+)